LIRIWEIWDGALEGPVTANARPAAFKGDILLVHVSSSPWVHHLHFLKTEIIHRLNHALGKPLVKDIKFKIGPL